MSGAVYQPKSIARRHVKTARQPLLSSCAIAAALVVAGHGAPVRAQSYIANVASTNNAIVRTGPGTTTVTVTAPTAIVNWTPTNAPGTDGVIAFQNSGTNAYFESPGVGDYRVLNRIIPSSGNNPISFNGTTDSVIGSIDGGPRGGTVWFYSPGGILLGSSARFNVGSLGLSTLDILDADFLDGNTGFSLAAGADSRASVTINSGAQINAPNEGSYVAIVSPRISQAGAVTVNGSAAYVAAEAADITINGGLFNIAVQTGSVVNAGGETTLTHSGATTGAGPTSGSDPQAIYMVAMPKNDAVTMLVGGTLGYATGASVENGVVVLSSGMNLTSASNGLGGVAITTTAGPAADRNASFTISGAAITSRLTGVARTAAAVFQGDGTTSFASSVLLTGGTSASITAQNGGTVTAAGNVTLRSAGGAARIDLNDGVLRTESDVLVDASATGANGANGGNATGGTASITLVNSTMETNRTAGSTGLTVSANGTGGTGLTGGNGNGGTASVSADDSGLAVGTLANPASLQILARGTGGNGQDGGAGGIGRGGTATLSILDSAPDPTPAILSANSIIVGAQGVGGGFEFGYGSNGGAGGGGIGGNASLTLSAGTLSAPNIDVLATGDGATGRLALGGPAGGAGGGGTGGVATFTINGGTLAGDSISIMAGGTGASGGDANEFGYGASGPGGAGGDGAGGTASFLQNGGNATATFIDVGASGSGGAAGDSASAAGGVGGDGNGGDASATLTGGILTVRSGLSVASNGDGGRGGFSSAAIAGVAGLGDAGGAHFFQTGGTATIFSIDIDAIGSGGQGVSGASGTSAGGESLGGLAEFDISGGSLDLAELDIDARGDGSDSSDSLVSGDARGGTARAIVSDAGALTLSSAITIDASAMFETVEGASAGDAFGGTASFLVENGGSFTSTGLSTDSLSILANATASSNFLDGAGANATGGTASFTVNDASVTLPLAINISAEGVGGDGFDGGNAGNGTGGSATLAANGGTIGLSGLLIMSAAGAGGFTEDGGNGGIGRGGAVSIMSAGGAASPFTPGDISLDTVALNAGGTGGAAASESGYGFGVGGGDGGAGIGGTASFEALNGSITTTGLTALLAQGTGGVASNGGTGGNGTGGEVSIVSGGDVNGAGLIDIANLLVDASGTGARSFETGYGSLAALGGGGGAGLGGDITLGTDGGVLTLANVALFAQADGGSGGMGTSRGGDGGAATGGSVTFSAAGSEFDLSSASAAIVASATGGDGGSGATTAGPGGSGGNGGAATGGSVIVTASGDGGALLIDPFILNNASLGAAGGNGGDGASGTIGGAGGDGGNAIGGAYEISTNLGSVTIAGIEGTGPSLSVTANGGSGGSGGDGSDVGDTGGDGGDGGAGMGGTIRVAINGGSASFGFTELLAHGNGGFGGSGGVGAGNPAAIPPISPTFASGGFDGRGRGGLVSIVVDDNGDTGAAGSASFADTSINVGGFIGDGFDDIGGRIEIYDNGLSPDGDLEFFSLNAVATGFSESSDQATGQVFDLFSADRRISILNDADITLDDAAYFRATGGGGLDVGGDFTLTTDFFAFVQHDFQPEIPADTISATNVNISTASDFRAFADSRINASDSIDISSTFGTIALNAASAGGNIDLNAPFDITGGALSAGGEVFVRSTSGGIDFDSITTDSDLLLRSATTVGLGGANVGGFIDVESTGNVTRFDNIVAGGDIEVDAGYNLALPDDSNVVLAPNSSVTAGSVTSIGGEIDIEATGSTTGGAFSAGHELSITSLTGSVALASAEAGTLNVPASADNNRSIGILAPGNVTVTGAATAAIDIGLGSVNGSVSAGSLTAGDNIVLLADGDVTLGSASAANLFYVAGPAMLPVLGTSPSNFDASNLIGVTPIPAGGDFTVTGTVEADTIIAAIDGNATINSLSAFTTIDLGIGGDLDAVSFTAGDEINAIVGGDAAIDNAVAGQGAASGGLFQVNALGNSSAGGAPLPSIDVVAGERITVSSSTDDLWSAGALPRFSDGDGLVATRFATASDDSGQPVGTQIGANFGLLTLGGFSAPFGALVGTVAGQRVLLGANGSFIAPASGTLQLNYWDSNSGDNMGSIAFTIMGRSALVNGSGFLTVQAGGSATVGYAQAGGAIDISANVLAIDAALSGGAINLLSNGATNAGSLIAAGDIFVDAGSIELVSAEAGGILLESASTIDAGALQADGDIFAQADGDIMIDSARADAGDIDLLADGGAVTVSDDISSGGQVSAFGTDIGLNAQGDLSIADLTATTGAISVNSGGTLSISGGISAETIQMASHDIVIGSAAEVGDQEVTQSLTLVNSADEQTVIGGGDEEGVWSLSNAEFGRLSAHEINLFGPEVSEFSGPDMLVRQLDIIGSQGADGGGRRRNLTGSILSIVSDGSIEVDGAVTLRSAAADDTIFLGAADSIDIFTPSGSITVTDAQGGIGGQILMAADEIFVGSDQASQDIAALSTTDEIDERLGTNDGAQRPEGYLQANAMQFAVVDALYIQNSGGPDLGSANRAGFTVGGGGVGIFTESSETRIIINGRQSNGSSGFVTGKDLIPLLRINGAQNPTGGFDLRSTANGCLIVGLSCRFDFETPVPPVQDVIEELIEIPDNQDNPDGTAVIQALNLPTIQFVDDAGLRFAPLIDEPVTGAGNDDFWIDDEEEPGEQ